MIIDFYRTSRQELVSLLVDGRSSHLDRRMSRRLWDGDRLEKGEVLLGWQQGLRRTSFPSMVVIPAEDAREVLAWVRTYLPDRTPFSSLTRVVLDNHLKLVLHAEEGSRDDWMQGALVGAVFGETLVETMGRQWPKGLAYRAFASTFSYAIARALCLGYPREVVGIVARRWTETITSVSARPRRVEEPVLVRVWETLFDLVRQPDLPGSFMPYDTIPRALRDLGRSGQLSEEIWEELTGGISTGGATYRKLQGTREERVLGFEVVRDLLLRRSGSNPERAFALGYMASTIAPGEMSHYSLLVPALSQLPAAGLWYGICAGLSRPGGLERSGDGLGWRLLRDMLRQESLASAPLSDVSFDELDIFFERGRPRQALRAENQSSLRVELFPRIYAVVPHGGPGLRSQAQADLFDDALASPADVGRFSQLGELPSNALSARLDRIERILNQVVAAQTRQRTLRKRTRISED